MTRVGLIAKYPPFGNAALRNHRTVVLAVILALTIVGPAVAISDDGAPPPRPTFRNCPDCPEMVVIPAGSFLMGSSAADSKRDYATMNPLERLFGGWSLAKEHPQHPVRIGHAFGLGRYPVTRGEFAAFIRATGYASAGGCIFYGLLRYTYHNDGSWQNPGVPQTPRDPVVCVSWQDAQAYIDWLNAKLSANSAGNADQFYRLPSESEWEYAARAGQQTARWWGDDIGMNNANCNGCGSFWDKRGTAPVNSFYPNQFWLYDMLGNVHEWTQDCWQNDYVGAPSDEIARIGGDCKTRVVRGSAWNSEAWTVRSATRFHLSVDQKSSYVGFRVAKTIH